MGLFSLVYVSFARQKMSDAELKEILTKSRASNNELNITGLLLYRNGFFIQVLEGEKEDVNAIYEKIKQDERHQSLLVIYRNAIRERSFEDWSMGFKVIDDETLRSLDGFSDFLDKPFTMDFFSNNPDYATILLNNFRTGRSAL